MNIFSELVASRKAWIENELKPWCIRAALKDLRLAEHAWPDIAGKVDPEKTLWYWAWGRFPALVNADLQAIDEARQIVVTLVGGESFTGFPDARGSKQGSLVVLCADPEQPRRFIEKGPLPMDQIASIVAKK